jgi:hypothetical protein
MPDDIGVREIKTRQAGRPVPLFGLSYYQRHLPHWQPEDAALFATWRLLGSLPITSKAWWDRPPRTALSRITKAIKPKNTELAPVSFWQAINHLKQDTHSESHEGRP